MLSKVNVINGLVLCLAIVGGEAWLKANRPPLDLSPATALIEFRPVLLGPIAPPGRIAGAWRVSSRDSRFGGVSGLALDHGRLLALNDAGMLLAFDRPGIAKPQVSIRPLPAVPGPAGFKIGRDSEALLRDPARRGWWVAFEQFHSVLLYDPQFGRLLKAIPVRNSGFTDNHGIEALAADHGRVRWLAEASGASDAARLPDGSTMLLERRIGLAGVSSWLERDGQRLALPLAWSDNPEALAAEPLAGGGTRLWVMTDNDLKAWRRKLLVAIDLPPPSRSR